MNFAALVKTKTFWTGIVAIVTAIGTFAMGDINLGAFMQTVFTSLIGIFLRDAITTKGSNASTGAAADDPRGR